MQILNYCLTIWESEIENKQELKPILKEIITLEDDRVIRLFEYIVINNDIQEEEFIEMVKDIKGDDKMSSLAQRWLDEGIQQGIQSGVEKVALGLLKMNVDIKIISTTTGLSIKELETLREKL
jgi:predicted transposase/invertase (TIGR01784 family)